MKHAIVMNQAQTTDVEKRPQLTRRAVLGAAGSVLLAGTPLRAQVAGPVVWPENVFAKLDLLGGGKTGQIYRAGLHIALRPGFKTYWRTPGDTGVPPQFSFAGSTNVKEVRVLFPVPQRFADGAGGASLGYFAPDVLFPIHIEPVDAGRPVDLHVKADYAVCERMCIPVSSEARLALSAISSHAAQIRSAEMRVPIQAKLGASGPVTIRSIARGQAAESLVIDVAVPEGAVPDLFVEAPSPWFFETRSFVRSAGGGRFEIVAVERDKALDCTGVDLVLTLAAPQQAIEVSTWLDVALLSP
jgi:DsbC/DsbD-like thiol-disulfide interchange protein